MLLGHPCWQHFWFGVDALLHIRPLEPIWKRCLPPLVDARPHHHVQLVHPARVVARFVLCDKPSCQLRSEQTCITHFIMPSSRSNLDPVGECRLAAVQCGSPQTHIRDTRTRIRMPSLGTGHTHIANDGFEAVLAAVLIRNGPGHRRLALMSVGSGVPPTNAGTGGGRRRQAPGRQQQARRQRPAPSPPAPCQRPAAAGLSRHLL